MNYIFIGSWVKPLKIPVLYWYEQNNTKKIWVNKDNIYWYI